MKQGLVMLAVSSDTSGRSVHELEYQYYDGAFGDWQHANIMICYDGKQTYSRNIDSLIIQTL